MAGIPYAARALVGTVRDAVMRMPEPIALKAILDDFQKQLKEVPVSSLVENIMQTGANTFVLHCPTTLRAEEVCASGFTFRNHQIVFKPAANTQWVKLTRVMYGTTEGSIKSKLSDYGTVEKIKQEKIHGVGISVYTVKVDLKKPIPSRIVINNAPVNVFYRGQIQQCFRCEQIGHMSRNCPFRRNTVPASRIVGPAVLPTASATDTPVISLPIENNGSNTLPGFVPPVPVASDVSSSLTFLEKAPGKRLKKAHPSDSAPAVVTDLPPKSAPAVVTDLPPVDPVTTILSDKVPSLSPIPSVEAVFSSPPPLTSSLVDPSAPRLPDMDTHELPLTTLPSPTSNPSLQSDSSSPPLSPIPRDPNVPPDYGYYDHRRRLTELYPDLYSFEDLEAVEKEVSPSVLARWKRTYAYRHPCYAQAAELRPFLDYYDRMIYPVGDLEDLTDSELSIVALPSTMKEDPELPYLLFEKLNLRRIVARRFPKKFANAPFG